MSNGVKKQQDCSGEKIDVHKRCTGEAFEIRVIRRETTCLHMTEDGRRQKIFVREKCMEHAFKVRESVCNNSKCKQTFGCTIYTRSDSAFTAGLPIKAPN